MSRPSLRHLLALAILAPWLATGCEADEPTPDEDTTPDPSTLPPFARDMLDTHNEVRAGVSSPRPSPALEPLGWSTAAETVAKKHVEKCEWGHNSERGNLGENIAAATPDYWDTEGVVMAWADEVADYNYENNSCATGKQCGHYTQVVWRATTRVGCATKVCTQNSPFGAQAPTWQYWVCNYDPPGNYRGQKPY
ncbi:CAP domain-containing protein [Pyxidicoccus trucidator]|uniref:CAP domain-containing protein n=1 Tax=Pyxidicoccus trucidator TaxID=2709662 RepID=UPI0013DC2101|nr:CAP domain-containing protein [Pyxidicoccus trucidator]